MKKAVATFLTLGLAVTGLVGCGKSTDDTQTTAAQNTEAQNTEEAQTTTAATSNFNTDKTITVVSREDGSGTRGAFIEITGVEQKDADGNKVDMTTDEAVISNSTNEVITAVTGDTYAIGYISLGSLNDTVKALKVDGVEATAENVANGTYAVQRPFNIATKGEAEGAAADFISYIMSSDGQAIIEENGYVSVSDADAYENTGVTGSIVVGGSSSVSPVMEKLIEAYEQVSEVTVDLQTTDSSTGMENAASGSYDIGMASRELKDSEVENGLVATVIAKDGIAIIVNNDNSFEDITSEQIKNIYTGDATKWSDVQ